MPSLSAEAGTNGDVHAAKAAPSRRHWNVAPASLVKLKLGRVMLVGVPIGVSVVSGAVVSTTNVRDAAVPVLVAGSVARTSRVYVPSAVVLSVRGDEHA